MSKIVDRVKRIFKRPRPVTREESEDIADWVNEGGAVSSSGPPPIIPEREEDR